MKRFLLMALALAACEPRPDNDLERWARSALVCPAGVLTWSVVEPGCGTIANTPGGPVYTAQACTDPWVDRVCTIHVSGCGRQVDMPVAIVDSDVQSLEVYCGMVAPETCCRLPPFSVGPGGQIQFYARFHYSCAGHVAYAPPAPPPPLCP